MIGLGPQVSCQPAGESDLAVEAKQVAHSERGMLAMVIEVVEPARQSATALLGRGREAIGPFAEVWMKRSASPLVRGRSWRVKPWRIE